MTDPAASAAAVALAVEAFGGLHVAHLNAGVTSWCGMGDDFDPEAYRRSMAINLDGVVYGIAAARPAIIASGGGTIVPRRRWPAWLRRRSIRFTRPTSTLSSASPARSARSRPEGIRIDALCPSFAYTNIIKGSEQTLLDMGFPIIEVGDVVARVPTYPRL